MFLQVWKSAKRQDFLAQGRVRRQRLGGRMRRERYLRDRQFYGHQVGVQGAQHRTQIRRALAHHWIPWAGADPFGAGRIGRSAVRLCRRLSCHPGDSNVFATSTSLFVAQIYSWVSYLHFSSRKEKQTPKRVIAYSLLVRASIQWLKRDNPPLLPSPPRKRDQFRPTAILMLPYNGCPFRFLEFRNGSVTL